MSKKTVQRASFEDLIARKAQRDADKNKTIDIYVQSFDRALTFHRPPQKEIYELVNEVDNSTFENSVSSTAKVIYHCCKQLQDPKLHKELDIADPYDVVASLIETCDIQLIGEELMAFLGLAHKDETIKN